MCRSEAGERLPHRPPNQTGVAGISSISLTVVDLSAKPCPHTIRVGAELGWNRCSLFIAHVCNSSPDEHMLHRQFFLQRELVLVRGRRNLHNFTLTV